MIELSNEEKTAFINLCASAQEIEIAAEFQNWMRTHVNAFFPFGMMAAVRGSILDDIIFVEQLISVDDPDEFLRPLQMQTKLSDRPVVEKWHREREPQMIHDAPMTQLIPHLACARENKYSLQNLAVHGQIDKQGHEGTYYCFARIAESLGERHRQKLKLMVPQLHHAMCKLRTNSVMPPAAPSNPCLTTREREILHLVGHGKTNREIAALLARSQRTINNHVHAILSKLGVANRAEATARLRQNG